MYPQDPVDRERSTIVTTERTGANPLTVALLVVLLLGLLVLLAYAVFPNVFTINVNTPADSAPPAPEEGGNPPPQEQPAQPGGASASGSYYDSGVGRPALP